MDDAGSCGGGRASGGINAKLAIHTKSAWVQVKRGEYISPGINLFELGLHWNNWTLQRSMISECSCGRRGKVGGREAGRHINHSAARRGPARDRATTRRDGEIKEGRRWRERQERRRAESEGKCPRDDEYHRRRVPRDVQVQFARNLCNDMRQTSSRVHRFIPAHAMPRQWNGYIVFIPHHVCACI